MRFFYGLFFVYRFGMLATRSIGGGYCHAGDEWQPPGPIKGHRGGCQRVIGGHRVLLEDTARAARMPNVSSWLAQFVYAVWRAPEREM